VLQRPKFPTFRNIIRSVHGPVLSRFGPAFLRPQRELRASFHKRNALQAASMSVARSRILDLMRVIPHEVTVGVDFTANENRFNVRFSPRRSIPKIFERATRSYDSGCEAQRLLRTILGEWLRSRTCKRRSQSWKHGTRKKKIGRNISRCKAKFS
jgi:hypothetical protein